MTQGEPGDNSNKTFFWFLSSHCSPNVYTKYSGYATLNTCVYLHGICACLSDYLPRSLLNKNAAMAAAHSACNG